MIATVIFLNVTYGFRGIDTSVHTVRLRQHHQHLQLIRNKNAYQHCVAPLEFILDIVLVPKIKVAQNGVKDVPVLEFLRSHNI